MNRSSYIYLLLILACATSVSCEKFFPTEPEPEGVLAGPLPGMTPDQEAAHIAGDENFAHVFGKDDGLGPIFVATSCENCHIGDGKGHPLTTLTRFGIWNGTSFDPLPEKGGPQLQHRAIDTYTGENVPAEATGVTDFVAPAVTGLGFIEAVPDSVFINLQAQQAATPDGITGELNLIDPPSFFVPKDHHVVQAGGKYIGRFGKKAGAIDLLMQVVNAYKQDMGITSDYDMEDLYNHEIGPFTGDVVDDPEVSAATVNNTVFYMQTLKAPERRDPDDPDVLAGEQLFLTIGCETCHKQTLTTGPSLVKPLSNVSFHPYTDMLMHDMGPGLNDGYTEGTALPEEWRTPPLWGIGLVEDSQGLAAFYLHDGRAKTLDDAITMHGGEAETSRNNYEALTQEEKDQLVKFLKSL